MRNKRLDVLRSVAILLVLVRHGRGQALLRSGGWAGVDLFFVLSGFLISGLLFLEFKRRGSIQFKRFFIRRGLKLYPSLYVLLLGTLAIQLILRQVSPFSNYLVEIFYVRNYFPGVWDHTWSLAVEEQFYVLLPILLLAMLRFSSNRVDPFRSILFAFPVVAVACLALRFAKVASIPAGQLSATVDQVYSPTQYRIDSLFFGVLVGYIYHFRPQYLAAIGRKWNAALLSILAGILISCAFWIPLASRFMLTVGFTLLYVGFGIALVLCLQVRDVLPRPLARFIQPLSCGLAQIGMYSYSIYLWHGAINIWFLGFLHRYLHMDMGPHTRDLIYVVASISFGILMSRAIEYPVLRIRDRIFPGIPTAVPSNS